MKYMLLIYGAEGSWTDAERTACMVESLAVCNRLAAQGKFLDASPLQSVTTAATVRVRDGRTLVTDGPFAETREQLGGYYVLDLADLDEAIAAASQLPPVSKGVVEIRPMATLENLPAGRPSAAAFGQPDGTPYLLLIYHDPGPKPECKAEEAVAFARRLDEAGQYVSASPLHPPEAATSVRVRGGKRIITDGPFAETTEVLGGYFLVRAGSREAAVDVAARLPMSRRASVEVRPLHDMTGLRNSVPTS